ncbi:hypothetical protein ACLMJK_006298 [Lecanora helva]
MAEAASLAVGVLALIGTFKECIDVCSYFADARSLGRDYELLITKLDLEKALLLQWAQGTKLLKPDYDKRLDDTSIQNAVGQTLAAVKLLLSDGQYLQQRYGLKDMSGEKLNQPPDNISHNHMIDFTKNFERLNIRIDRHRTTFTGRKVRWVIRDKAKFGKDGLSVSSSIEQTPLKADPTFRLRLVEDCEQRILQCLWFRLIDDRRDSLAEPNPQTFKWAIDPSNDDPTWDSLSK